MNSPKYDNRNGIFPKWADFVSQILVVYSLIAFTLETEPEFIGHEFFFYSEVVVTIIFTLEYCTRLYLAEDRWGYMKSFYGLVDFFATAPIIMTFGFVDLRFARAIRLLRLLRLLKFVRYAESTKLLAEAFKMIKGELAVLLFAILGIVYVAAVGIYHFEHEAQPEAYGSILSSMWWAFITLTTVGYGDVYPITAAGKIFTVIILIMGLGIVAIPSGLLASALTRIRRRETEAIAQSKIENNDLPKSA